MSAPAKNLFLASVHGCRSFTSQMLAVCVIWSVVTHLSDIRHSRYSSGAGKESLSSSTQPSSLSVAVPEASDAVLS